MALPIPPGSGSPGPPSNTDLLRELLTSDAAWSRLVAEIDFSPRQAHAGRGILGGRTYKQIAAPLGCSAETIHAHVEKVLDRVGLHGDDRHRCMFTARILDRYAELRDGPPSAPPH
ncbi:MAG TPA: LuxR C-terminal-related transcriptional regulator [Phycisphaerae bacterium]|jgi:DNA-binding NarL/FixJ family response regulator